jgi:diguanylate cyclase (GGDEF)-like protein
LPKQESGNRKPKTGLRLERTRSDGQSFKPESQMDAVASFLLAESASGSLRVLAGEAFSQIIERRDLQLPTPRPKPESLWNPGSLLKPWGWFIALLAFISAIVGLARDDISFVQKILAPEGNYLNPRTFVLAFLASNVLTFYLVYHFLYRERFQRREDADENANLRLLLDDIERERLLDLHTGIPNEKKFTNDFAALKGADLATLPAQIILIDIDNFRSVNNKYGHQKGNEVIRLIAQKMFLGMRRDEEIYTPRNAELYRRFTGGDEFIFLVRGHQYQAVGFLTRLHETLEKLSAETRQMLGKEFKIDFHGAIAPIYRKDDYKDAVARLEQCYVETKKATSTRRVYWWKDEEREFSPKDFRFTLYERAIKRFTLNPANQVLLGFYVVSEQPGPGVHYFDSPAFPQLGYIADKPDLLISQLKAVSIGSYRDRSTIVHADGSREQSDEDRPSLEIHLMATDAKALEDLPGAQLGGRLLLMLRNEPLLAPVVRMKTTIQSIQVGLQPGADAEKLKRSLETLVQDAK